MLAALPGHPVTKNSQGKLVQEGAVFDDKTANEVCITRQLYNLIISRKAEEKLIKHPEYTYYIPDYLSDQEFGVVRRHLARPAIAEKSGQ